MLVFKYLKSCCVDNRDITTFICLDDEAIIPVGEGVKGHNKVLTPADGPRLVCIDHDFQCRLHCSIRDICVQDSST